MFIKYIKNFLINLLWYFATFTSLFIFYKLFTDYNVIQSKPYIVKFILYYMMFLTMFVNSLIMFDKSIYQRKSNSAMDLESFTVWTIVFIVVSFVISILCSIPSPS